MPKKNVPSLLLLICLVGLPQISETIYTPALIDLAADMHASYNQIQFTLSIYFIGFALGVYFWGRVSDSLGRRSSMLIGIFTYVVGSIACLWSPTVQLLFVARFIQAFGASVGSVVTQAILRECINENDRPAVFAKISAAIAFTPALGPLIGGWINQLFGVSSIFLILIFIGALMLLYTFISLPETNIRMGVKVNSLGVLRRMISDLNVWTFVILIGVTNGIIFSYYGEAPFVFIEYFGMTSGAYGFFGLIVALASIAGAMYSKRLLKKYSPLEIIVLGCKISVLASLLLSLITLLVDSRIALCVLMSLCIFILLFGISMIIPNSLSLVLADYSTVLGTAGAILGLEYYIIVSLISSGMGYLHNGALITMPLYFVVLALLMYAVAKLKHKSI